MYIYIYKVVSVNISFACSVSFENKSLSLSLQNITFLRRQKMHFKSHYFVCKDKRTFIFTFRYTVLFL